MEGAADGRVPVAVRSRPRGHIAVDRVVGNVQRPRPFKCRHADAIDGRDIAQSALPVHLDVAASFRHAFHIKRRAQSRREFRCGRHACAPIWILPNPDMGGNVQRVNSAGKRGVHRMQNDGQQVVLPGDAPGLVFVLSVMLVAVVIVIVDRDKGSKSPFLRIRQRPRRRIVGHPHGIHVGEIGRQKVFPTKRIRVVWMHGGISHHETGVA